MGFQKIKGLQTLYLVRQDLFNGEYVLTDHHNNFGKLVYEGLARETAEITSCYGEWCLGYDFEPFGNTKIIIYDNANVVQGTITVAYNYLEALALLAMNDEFTATFSKDSLISNTYEWKASGPGSLIHIKNAMFSLTNTITVTNISISEERIILLGFLAQHLLILKSRNKWNSY